jgi:signal transduction histidine kinase
VRVSASLDVADEARHAEMTRGMRRTNRVGLLAFLLLVAVATGGAVGPCLWVAGCALALFAINWRLTDRLVAMGARRAEPIRILASALLWSVSAYCAGAPLPAWMILPVVAVAYDSYSGRYAWMSLGAAVVAMTTVGILRDVSWMYPVAFTVLAAYCLQVSHTRFALIQEMLAHSEAQRQTLAQAEVELRQAQKLESIGRLAAGIAHELNTPAQFASDSVQFVRDGCGDLLAVIACYRRELEAMGDGKTLEAARAAAAQAEDDHDLAYLAAELGPAATRAGEGLGQIAAIVRSIKHVARDDEGPKCPVDVTTAIQATTTMAAVEWRAVADLELDLATLPPLHAHPGQLHQSLLHLLTNAAHAIADTGRRGRITVRSRQDGDDVVIEVHDTGTGIPASIQDRVFDPFFTTKPLGKGTGQGLAAARATALAHGGSLTFTTKDGAGSAFFLRLPSVAHPSHLVAA